MFKKYKKAGGGLGGRAQHLPPMAFGGQKREHCMNDRESNRQRKRYRVMDGYRYTFFGSSLKIFLKKLGDDRASDRHT